MRSTVNHDSYAESASFVGLMVLLHGIIAAVLFAWIRLDFDTPVFLVPGSLFYLAAVWFSPFLLPDEYYDKDDSDNVCFLCENPQYTELFQLTNFGFPFNFQKCQCGMVKQTPLPNKQFFEWFFNSELFFSSKSSNKEQIWGYYDFFNDEPSRLRTSRKRYRKLKKYFPSRDKLEFMKIGPSTGTFLYFANLDGQHAIGCDVSAEFAGYAKQNYQVQIDNGRFEQMPYDENQFDVIVIFNVIENIPNLDEFLTSVRRTLKNGGLLILNYVDMAENLVAKFQKKNYFLYRPPVCYIFDREVMLRVLNKYGMETVDTIRDMRFMTLEKILTLLGWRWPLRIPFLKPIFKIPFPVYAYPSKLIVARCTK